MRQATPRDLPALLAVLEPSFALDPHVTWFIGHPADPALARRRRALMRLLCHHALSCGQAWLSDDGQAAALWRDSARKPGGAAYLAANLGYLWHCGPRATLRSLGMEAALERRLPRTPYRFLWTIGVAEAARGRGLFGELIKPMLAEADIRGQETWLETTVQRNVEIYTHYGFAVMERYRYQDSPEITLMRRQAGEEVHP